MNKNSKKGLKKRIYSILIGFSDDNKRADEIVNVFEIYVLERDAYQKKLEDKIRDIKKEEKR